MPHPEDPISFAAVDRKLIELATRSQVLTLRTKLVHNSGGSSEFLKCWRSYANSVSVAVTR